MEGKAKAAKENKMQTGTASNPSSQNYPTPLRAIRLKCLDCRGFEKADVRACAFDDCSLHPLRMGKGSRSTLKPIKTYCIWCVSGQKQEVRLCPSSKCTLWPYRLGRRPQIPRSMPDFGATAGLSHAKGLPPVQDIECKAHG
jgi:hypothetical protein